MTLPGFGTFEKRERAARTARNPQTGESVKVKKTSVPAFKPGTGFKSYVASSKGTRRRSARLAADASPSLPQRRTFHSR